MNNAMLIEELEEIQAPMSDSFWYGVGIGATVAAAIVALC